MRDAYDPHGAAVLDCFHGVADAVLICHQDGVHDDVPPDPEAQDAAE